uniref:Protein TonB n=1 Tax=Candidatus Kentrum sp. SD TaxID=2126332 RepID=A0A450YJD9_9GAMM|nr:MAG: protein TonB [Candidatus Kentron sp. SD]VFK47028.1 MAG: protein TonB [Candidatus Kentron sp. SD]
MTKTNGPIIIGLFISILTHAVVAAAMSVFLPAEPAPMETRRAPINLTLVGASQGQPQPSPKKPLPQRQKQRPPPKTASRPAPTPAMEEKRTKQAPKKINANAIRTTAKRAAPKMASRSAPRATAKIETPLRSAFEAPTARRTPAPAPGAHESGKTSSTQSATTITRREQQYLAALKARIERKKFYPPLSRRRGEEGKVVIAFVIRKNGQLTHLSVRRSSGIRRLDNAALRTLREITPVEPIPAMLEREEWALSAPIIYGLRE